MILFHIFIIIILLIIFCYIVYKIYCKKLYIPSIIVLIRHGEKNPDENYLNPQGKQRASLLPSWVNSLTEKFNQPIVGLYTPLPRDDGMDFRPRQTVEPTSFELDLPLYGTKYNYECKKAVNELLSNPVWEGKAVLVCWEHTCLQKFIETLSDKLHLNLKRIPYWDSDDFSSVYIIDTKNKSITKECENLLETDTENCAKSNQNKPQECRIP